MGTTIVAGLVTITPDLVLGYETSTDSQNIEHTPLGTTGATPRRPSYTLIGDTLRAGTIRLCFEIESDARAARSALTQALPFTLTSDELDDLGMTFIRDGAMTLALDDETFNAWTLDVDYREVSA